MKDMKLIVNSKEILKAVQLVGGLIKAQSPVPILETVLFNIAEGILHLEADNLEVRSKFEMPVEFFGNYFTCIPYNLLVSILKGFPDGPVEFEFTDKIVYLRASGGEYNIPVENATDFPKNKIEDAGQSLNFNSLDLVEAIKKALAFVSSELGSWDSTVMVWITGDNTRIVGGTAKAIYEQVLPVTGPPKKLLLSKNTASYLVQSISAEEALTMSYTDNKVFFTLEHRQITAVLSNAQYPPYEGLFDKMVNDKEYRIDKDNLLPPLKRLSNITDKEHPIIKFNFSADKLSLSYNYEFKTYSATEVIDIDYTGDDLETGFPANQLINILNFTHGETIMGLSGSTKPCLIKQGDIRCLIAAMRPETNTPKAQ